MCVYIHTYIDVDLDLHEKYIKAVARTGSMLLSVETSGGHIGNYHDMLACNSTAVPRRVQLSQWKAESQTVINKGAGFTLLQ